MRHCSRDTILASSLDEGFWGGLLLFLRGNPKPSTLSLQGSQALIASELPGARTDILSRGVECFKKL
ncbi:hypothetical protein GN956_G22065 [Arapaima gigas]